MTPSETLDDEYAVVINDEEQYSIWPRRRALPDGWRETGHCGRRAECLARIEQVWTDMRPRSVRQAAERATGDDE